MTGDIFVNWMQHFKKFSHATKESLVLLVLDGHVSHKNLAVLQFAKENGIILLCLPAHCSHRLQPLDVSFFAPLKAYLNQEVTKKIRSNDGKPISQLQVARVFRTAYERAATIENAASGFKNSGLWPINPDVFPEHLFAPSITTDQHDVPSDTQSTTAEPNTANELCKEGKTPNNENGTRNEEAFVSLAFLSPMPSTSKVLTRKREKTPTVLTSSPFIEEMKQKEVEKTEKVRRQTARQAKKRLQIDPGDVFEEELKFPGERLDKEDNSDAFCLFCGEAFSRSKGGEKWIRCCKCNEWAHVLCAGVDPKTKIYICDACQ